ALIGRAFHLDASAVRLDEILRQVEAQAGSAAGRGLIVFRPEKPSEKPIPLLRAHSYALVANRDFDPRSRFAAFDREPGARERVLDRVIDEITYHLRDQVRIDPGREEGLELKPDLDP